MISSAHNPRIRQLRLLMEKSRTRRDEKLFVIEGVRELEIAIQSGYSMHSLFLCEPILQNSEKTTLFKNRAPVVEAIDPDLYRKIAYRGTTEGVLAIMHERFLQPGDLSVASSALVIVLESVEKPGNLGAVLRTADACRADAVMVCDPLTDLYNPNTIRASLGCLFSVPNITCTSAQAYQWLQDHGIRVVAATCQAEAWYHQCDYRLPTAFAMGTEDKGLSAFWRERADQEVKIPMRGIIDSLNVSVATAVLCFEAVRQRNI